MKTNLEYLPHIAIASLVVLGGVVAYHHFSIRTCEDKLNHSRSEYQRLDCGTNNNSSSCKYYEAEIKKVQSIINNPNLNTFKYKVDGNKYKELPPYCILSK